MYLLRYTDSQSEVHKKIKVNKSIKCHNRQQKNTIRHIKTDESFKINK